jgi:benzoyl-CoA reductase subunit C
MEAMGSLHDVIVNHHQYAQAWKEKTGGKVFGYLCSYCPEEILYAAGILPVRVVGSHEPPNITETHVSNRTCLFGRDILAQGLLGRYSYLDGIVLTHACQHIQLMFHRWRLHVPTPFKYLIYFPTLITSRGAKSLITANLKTFATSLEDWLVKPISIERLDNAIQVYNSKCRLLRELYERYRPWSGLTDCEGLAINRPAL